LQEHRTAAVDVPLTRGKPVSLPFFISGIRLYIYLAEDLLAERSRDEAREREGESKEGEGCNERGQETEDTGLEEHKEHFCRQLTTFPE
jgi:hypothetical protein